MTCFEGLVLLFGQARSQREGLAARQTHTESHCSADAVVVSEGLQAPGRERNRGDASTGAAPATSCLDGALSWFCEAPGASESESGATASSPCHMHVSVEGVPHTVADHAGDSNLWPDLHMTIKAEAFDMAATHVLNMVTTSTESEQAHTCTICGQAVIGVVFDSPWSGLAHYRCAAAEYELLLWSRERRHLRRCRQKVHKERWEDARTKRKPKQRFGLPMATTPPPNPGQLPSCMPITCSVVTTAASMANVWTAFRTCLPTLPNFTFHLLSDLVATGFRRARSSIAWHERSSCREVLKWWAEGVQREATEEAAAEAAKELLGFGDSEAASKNSFLVILRRKGRRLLASFIARRFADAADVAHGRRREKRLVQQGSRGAHLARMTAVRRGVRLCKWSHVRRHRAAHRWVHGSTLGSSLIYVFSLVATVYKGTCSMMRGLARFACGLWQGEPLRRDTSTDGLRSSAAARRVRSDAYELACQVSLIMELAYPPARTRLRIMCTHVRGRVGRVRTRDYDPDA